MRFALTLALVALATALAFADSGAIAPTEWTVRPLATYEGFSVPESVWVGPDGVAYVSNIASDAEGYWSDDKVGWISALPADATPARPSVWANSEVGRRIHAPKGVCILGGVLYAADNTLVIRRLLATGEALAPIAPPGAQHLNDLATDGRRVYATDTQGSCVYRLDPEGAVKLPACDSINGLTFHNGRGYCVSWALHDVFTFDPTGRKAPEPMGVAEHFTNLDGIEVLCDGTIVVSDFYGNKVSAIAPDGTDVRTLVELESPADIGLDRERGILWVPQFLTDTVRAYALERR